MLKPENRLRKKKDFQTVFDTGKSFFASSLKLVAAKNDLEVMRAGFVVSNKVSKIAAKRNKIKRQLREIVRLQADTLKSGYDLVFAVHPKIVDSEYAQIAAEVNEVLKKADLYK